MMTMLLIAGIAVLAAGLLAIVFGIPVKEFSFGNTLIVAGAVAACTGAVLLGLSLVVRELRNIVRRLESANTAATPRAADGQRPSITASGGPLSDNRLQPDNDEAAAENSSGAKPAVAPSPLAVPSAPWQEEATVRDRTRSHSDIALEPARSEMPATKPRRNLLFSSSSRKERERAARTADPAGAAATPVAASTSEDAASATFDAAWPQTERAQPDPLRRPRTPSTFAEPSAATPAPEPERSAPVSSQAEPAPVTVLKSGVVDGMAYSLYSDGSIEAQMPEGMMRFASIDELRAHLDQRP